MSRQRGRRRRWLDALALGAIRRGIKSLPSADRRMVAVMMDGALEQAAARGTMEAEVFDLVRGVLQAEGWLDPQSPRSPSQVPRPDAACDPMMADANLVVDGMGLPPLASSSRVEAAVVLGLYRRFDGDQ